MTPPTVSPDMTPVYSGFIVVTNNNDVFNVPYVGQPFDLETANLIAPIVPYSRKYPDASGSYVSLWGKHSPSNSEIQAPDDNFISYYSRITEFSMANWIYSLIDAPGMYPHLALLTYPTHPTSISDIQSFSLSGLSYPTFVFGTTNICDYLRLDIVPANTSFVPDKYGFDPNVTHDDLVYPDLPLTTVAGLEIIGTLQDYGYGPWARSEFVSLSWIDSSVPNADYRVVMRILRSGGDYEDPKAWQTWMSAIVRVV